MTLSDTRRRIRQGFILSWHIKNAVIHWPLANRGDCQQGDFPFLNGKNTASKCASKCVAPVLGLVMQVLA